MWNLLLLLQKDRMCKLMSCNEWMDWWICKLLCPQAQNDIKGTTTQTQPTQIWRRNAIVIIANINKITGKKSGDTRNWASNNSSRFTSGSIFQLHNFINASNLPKLASRCHARYKLLSLAGNKFSLTHLNTVVLVRPIPTVPLISLHGIPVLPCANQLVLAHFALTTIHVG